MAKNSFERARWKRREARRRLRIGGFWCGFLRPSIPRTEQDWSEGQKRIQRNLDRSVHGCMSEASRVYRRQWRSVSHRICRLYLLEDSRAEELDPQPRRLGIMWQIW
jgi:hypothetical protein